MDIFFLIIAVLALVHFVYENIILPTIRLQLRYRLFELRDDLRRLKIDHGNDVSDDLFRLLQESINNSLGFLPRADLQFLVHAREVLRNDPRLRERIAKRRKLLDECKIDAVKAVRVETVRVFECAIVANSGMTFLYVIPALCGIAMLSTLKAFVRELVSLSQSDIEKIAPFAKPAFA